MLYFEYHVAGVLWGCAPDPAGGAGPPDELCSEAESHPDLSATLATSEPQLAGTSKLSAISRATHNNYFTTKR
jgi:hypothetical protein